MANRNTVTCEQAVLLPDGNTQWQVWTLSAITDGDGRVKEIQAIGRDITDRKRAEEALRRISLASADEGT